MPLKTASEEGFCRRSPLRKINIPYNETHTESVSSKLSPHVIGRQASLRYGVLRAVIIGASLGKELDVTLQGI